MSFEWLEEVLACPVCGRAVRRGADSYRCTGCSRLYPIRYGIPDFRLAPDPYITIEDEIRKIEGFYAPDRSFTEMVKAYYELTPESPPELHRHYLAAMAAATSRGAGILKKLRTRYPDVPRRRLLDLGCGTAGMSIAAAAEYDQVAGVDVALRWLVMGQRRLAEQNASVPLVCANAESLPFRDGAFQSVVADSVLEHVQSSVKMRDETLRVLEPGGAFFFTTNNRFSILPEPHVRLLGFGFLPRPLMEPVARRVRRTPYKARLHSRRELKQIFKGFGSVMLPWYEASEIGERHAFVVNLWDRLRTVAPIRALLGTVVPQYFISGRRSPAAPLPAHPSAEVPARTTP